MGTVVLGGLGVSVDGCFEDASGDFGWGAPHEDAHRISNELVRDLDAFVAGRRMYETMEPYWPDAAASGEGSEIEREFAQVYVATPRYVVSDSLSEVGEGVTLVPRAKGRALVERLKAESEGLIEVGGPEFAESVIDLVDEVRLFVHPIALGAGRPVFRTRVQLELLEARTLEGGVLYLRYECASP